MTLAAASRSVTPPTWMTKKDGDATPLPPEGQDMTGSALYKVFVADTSFRAESLHIFALVRSQQVIRQIGRLDPIPSGLRAQPVIT